MAQVTTAQLAHCDGMDNPMVQEAGRVYVQAYSEFMPYSE
jgi:hypothetical protein